MTATVVFGDLACALQPGETVLDGLLRHDQAIPHSCRSGHVDLDQAARSLAVRRLDTAPAAFLQRYLRAAPLMGLFTSKVMEEQADKERPWMAPQWVGKQKATEPKQLIGRHVEAGEMWKRATGSTGTVVQTMATDDGARIAIRWDQDGTIDWLTPSQWQEFIIKL